ncbi:PT domain-containing protein [Nocardioides sp. zg-536]|uniref:PT domain-containing protein n=1 Tax=Nocardioides faecalis TaxID=2803858 RepID=A0A938Y7Y6_9ACTN|nr:PT domain-containing protein [Nocardioides faecalis]MBM9460940.1 PT domain-containing protein [Nocardioides faecalis]QVI59235.1 PT domain-containing protein [Nocardioides faecalis]
MLGLLVGVLVAALGASAYLVLDRGAGGNPVSRLDSLIDPAPDPSQEREKALAAARTFVERFNTYGPGLLADDGTMPDYAAVGELMSAKFAKVFGTNVGYAEQTVAETGIERAGQVHAVGVAAIDEDSAELLVAGIVTFSYPASIAEDGKAPEDDAAGADGDRVGFEPVRFRYQVSLVKIDGTWKVDDLDDLDDELGSFADSQGEPDQAPSDQASEQPSEQPSGQPSSETSTPAGPAQEETP